MSKEASDTEKVNMDLVYQEKNEEMRRYRDYELSIATWISSVQLAIIGFIVSNLAKHITYQQKWVIGIISGFFTLAGILSVFYASKRHQEHADLIFYVLKLEPKYYRRAWKDKQKSRKCKCLQEISRPKNLIPILLFLLFFITVYLLIWS